MTESAGNGLFRLAGPVEHEIEVKRSRFIAALAPIRDEEQARAEIARIRRVHSKARHHCTAFVLGGMDGAAVTRTNDDGEPSGTAGAPMLAALQSVAATDVVAVVTRYFGGVLLGTGGLTRAYGGAVSAALEHAELAPVVRRTVLELTADYPDAAAIEALARSAGWVTLEADYGIAVALRLATPPEQSAEAIAQIAAATGGRVVALPAGHDDT